MPDENDITYNAYGFDLVAFLRAFIENVFFSEESAFSFGGILEWLVSTLSFWWNIYSILAFILSALFLAGLIYAKIRLGQLGEFHEEQLLKAEEEWARRYGGVTAENTKWANIQQHISSENPNDWRLAIIEADIMLEDTLEQAGYVGASIGEKLKSANPSSFKTVQDAWDAHKVRNEIAHAGSDFVLTRRVASETMLKYQHVFQEFGVL